MRSYQAIPLRAVRNLLKARWSVDGVWLVVAQDLGEGAHYITARTAAAELFRAKATSPEALGVELAIAATWVLGYLGHAGVHADTDISVRVQSPGERDLSRTCRATPAHERCSDGSREFPLLWHAGPDVMARWEGQ